MAGRGIYYITSVENDGICCNLNKKSNCCILALNCLLRFMYSLLHGCRYPYDEAATVAISTVKEFAGIFKEVSSLWNRQSGFPSYTLNLICINVDHHCWNSIYSMTYYSCESTPDCRFWVLHFLPTLVHIVGIKCIFQIHLPIILYVIQWKYCLLITYLHELSTPNYHLLYTSIVAENFLPLLYNMTYTCN